MPGAHAILGSNPSGPTNAHVKNYHFFTSFIRLILINQTTRSTINSIRHFLLY
jgi:hypothetical protein